MRPLIAGAAFSLAIAASFVLTERPASPDEGPGTRAMRPPPRSEANEQVAPHAAQRGVADAGLHATRGTAAAPVSGPKASAKRRETGAAPPKLSLSAVDDPTTFASTVRALASRNEKGAFRELLRGWRSGTTSREQNLLIGEAVASARPNELTKAAGRLLLEVPRSDAQVEAFCSLLAHDGSATAVEYLVWASRDARLRGQALEWLATLSNPQAIPFIATLVNEQTDPDVVGALRTSLERSMEAEEAKALLKRAEFLTRG